MADYDVFNGDADGICSLIQLRLAEPRNAILITGVKRDIDLLRQVDAQAGDRITVVDVSMEKNIEPLNKALAAAATVFYVDHHVPGAIPSAANLTAIINEAPDVCTALLVNGYLQGKFAAWALVGAYGDNLKTSAQALAKTLSFSPAQLELLEELGIYINYNGYGEKIEDLHFAPAKLFELMSQYADPLDFIVGSGKAHFEKLQAGYRDDMAAAAAIKPEVETESAAVFVFPDEAWARRVSGVYSNDLVNQFPHRAHAVLTAKRSGTYLVSVRAPLSNKTGAAELCKQFPTGGGRAAAAGINDLPGNQFTQFVDRFRQFYAAPRNH
jgi:single-stranded DNA-specific DHH superfamily exonuclease